MASSMSTAGGKTASAEKWGSFYKTKFASSAPSSKSATPSSSPPPPPAPVQQPPSASRSKVGEPVGPDSAPPKKFVYLLSTMRGVVVQCTLRDGRVYEGAFSTCRIRDGVFSVRLAWAQLLNSAATRNTNPYEEMKTIVGTDIACMTVKQHDMDTNKIQGSSGFTDGEIGHHRGTSRRLERWQADDDANADDDLESSGSNGRGRTRGGGGGNVSGEWDQFEHNKREFGVTSTFDFDLYSAPLDPNSEFYKKNARDAGRIADGIMKKKSTNIYAQEDRGHDINNDVDEETLYSAVDTTPTPKSRPKNPNAYTVPARRNHSPAAAAGGGVDAKGKATPVAAAAAPAAAKTTTAGKSKLNPKAKEFKFNATAPAFVPTGFHAAAPPPQMIPPQHMMRMGPPPPHMLHTMRPMFMMYGQQQQPRQQPYGGYMQPPQQQLPPQQQPPQQQPPPPQQQQQRRN